MTRGPKIDEDCSHCRELLTLEIRVIKSSDKYEYAGTDYMCSD